MDSNTNQLFFIITGAIVVASIFGLVQANISGSITEIFGYFNGLFNF